MPKRTSYTVKKDILHVLSDNEEHTYGNIERKANTNWQTVRDHCTELELFGAATITSKKKIKITKFGTDILKKMRNKNNKIYK